MVTSFILKQICSAVLPQVLIWTSLMTTGLLCEEYRVNHIFSSICAVRHSTVLIFCKYSHPKREQVGAAEWLYRRSQEDTVSIVSRDPAFVGRAEPVLSPEADGGNCSLLLRDVRESDGGIFQFVFRTGVSAHNWTNDHGVNLQITDADVKVKSQSDPLTEGDWMTLSCGSCIPSVRVPTYIWRRDGRLHSQHYGDNMLDLDSVCLEDGGGYSCTISGHEGLNSPSVIINVRPGYSPKKTSVSIRPPNQIVEGSSVTLTCSSDSKPPVQNYTWFKENETSPVGSGQRFSALQSGWFYCVAQNKYGSQRSAAVSVTVKALDIVIPGIISAVLISSVILMVAMGMFIRRKRVTPSEEQNNEGLSHNKKTESLENTYVTLDPLSRCSDYDTLDNVQRSCGITDGSEYEDTTYYNIEK